MTKEQEEAIEMFKELEMCDDKEFVNARETILSMLEEKDKQIDLMAEYIDFDKMNFECSSLCVKDNGQKDCIKQYFENKVRQESDKGATGK